MISLVFVFVLDFSQTQPTINATQATIVRDVLDAAGCTDENVHTPCPFKTVTSIDCFQAMPNENYDYFLCDANGNVVEVSVGPIDGAPMWLGGTISTLLGLVRVSSIVFEVLYTSLSNRLPS
jgi:hypothetical protein